MSSIAPRLPLSVPVRLAAAKPTPKAAPAKTSPVATAAGVIGGATAASGLGVFVRMLGVPPLVALGIGAAFGAVSGGLLSRTQAVASWLQGQRPESTLGKVGMAVGGLVGGVAGTAGAVVGLIGLSQLVTVPAGIGMLFMPMAVLAIATTGYLGGIGGAALLEGVAGVRHTP